MKVMAVVVKGPASDVHTGKTSSLDYVFLYLPHSPVFPEEIDVSRVAYFTRLLITAKILRVKKSRRKQA